MSLSLLPPNALIGLITFGRMVMYTCNYQLSCNDTMFCSFLQTLMPISFTS